MWVWNTMHLRLLLALHLGVLVQSFLQSPRAFLSRQALFNSVGRRETSSEWCNPDNRGHDHLTAFIEDGDMIIWRSGSWWIDGVEVGDGSPSRLRMGTVAAIQLVWTQDCEHGVIHAEEFRPVTDDEFAVENLNSNDATRELAQLGPEQLLAVIEANPSPDTRHRYLLQDSWLSIETRSQLRFLSST